jgi:hypothetical protein
VHEAPSWLDRELRQPGEKGIPNHGYGREVRDALYRRQQWLVGQGLAEVEGDKLLLAPDMNAILKRRELARVAGQMSRELGLQFDQPVAGEVISGICRRRVDLSSGSFALVERSREFSLVPWRPEMERALCREISGRVRDSGGISWTLGRGRSGPEIGM